MSLRQRLLSSIAFSERVHPFLMYGWPSPDDDWSWHPHEAKEIWNAFVVAVNGRRK